MQAAISRTAAESVCRPRPSGAVGSDSAAASLARDEVLEVEQVGARALADPNQRGHQGDLLDLLLEEPVHELLAEEVALVARDGGQPGDLLGDGALLIERQAQRLGRRGEGVAHGVGAGDLDLDVAIDQVLHQHHRVVALVEGLGVEVLGELRQVGSSRSERRSRCIAATP